MIDFFLCSLASIPCAWMGSEFLAVVRKRAYYWPYGGILDRVGLVTLALIGSGFLILPALLFWRTQA